MFKTKIMVMQWLAMLLITALLSKPVSTEQQ